MTELAEDDRSEALRKAWHRRFNRLVEDLAGPVETVASYLGAETTAERVERAAKDIERARLLAGLQDSGQAPKRKDPLWAHRKRFGR